MSELIDITRHQNMLDAASEWLWLRILQRDCERTVLDIFFETGILLQRVDIIPDFNKWYESNGWRFDNY